MHPAQFPDRMKLVQALHAHWESLTGNKCTLSYARIFAWHELIQRGYNASDVALVVRWVRRQMAKQGTGYSPASLQFSRLIADTDLFEDRLNLARHSWQRAPLTTTKSPPPPENWKEWVTATYPKANIPRRWDELHADVKQECREALKK